MAMKSVFLKLSVYNTPFGKSGHKYSYQVFQNTFKFNLRAFIFKFFLEGMPHVPLALACWLCFVQYLTIKKFNFICVTILGLEPLLEKSGYRLVICK